MKACISYKVYMYILDEGYQWKTLMTFFILVVLTISIDMPKTFCLLYTQEIKQDRMLLSSSTAQRSWVRKNQIFEI